jgi:hypothetical protein
MGFNMATLQVYPSCEHTAVSASPKNSCVRAVAPRKCEIADVENERWWRIMMPSTLVYMSVNRIVPPSVYTAIPSSLRTTPPKRELADWADIAGLWKWRKSIMLMERMRTA